MSKNTEVNSARNVNKKLINKLAAERKANPSAADQIKSGAFKASILARRHDNAPEIKRLREKFEREEFVENRSCDLYEQYKAACVNSDPKIVEKNLNTLWAQAVQAVKTDKVPSFQEKWGDRMRKVKNAV